MTILAGSGLGEFTCELSGLTSGTHYYLRAYAINAEGVGYGDQVEFGTMGLPVVNTILAKASTLSSINMRGEVISDGGDPSATRGFCYSIYPNPTINDFVVESGNGTGVFNESVSGLSELRSYFVRAFVTNSFGTSYGEELEVYTLVVGTKINGGIVVHLDSVGKHGMVVIDGIIKLINWWDPNKSLVLTGANGVSFGTGSTNTDAIVQQHGSGNYAAYTCYNYNTIYSDWFLPSKDELNIVRQNLGVLPNLQQSNLSTLNVWSSTEKDLQEVWIQNFGTGEQKSDLKTSFHAVIAVRYF